MKKTLLNLLLICAVLWGGVTTSCTNASGGTSDNSTSNNSNTESNGNETDNNSNGETNGNESGNNSNDGTNGNDTTEENTNNKITLYTPTKDALWEPEVAFAKFGTLSKDPQQKNPQQRSRAANDQNQGNQVQTFTFTGLLGMTNILTQESTLKEYDSFNADITSYVEKVNVEADADIYNKDNFDLVLRNGKKYVQFTIWRDTDPDHKNIVLYETRIFTYTEDQPISAKCVWFSPDLTVDVVRRKNITKDNTQDKFTVYKYPYATYKDKMAEKDYNIVEEYYFTDAINNKMKTFGNVSNLTSCRNKMWPRISNNDNEHFIVSKYYQYEGDLTIENLKSSPNTTPISNANMIWAKNYTGLSDRNPPAFIELLAKVNRQSNEIELYQINYHKLNTPTQTLDQNGGNGGSQEPNTPYHLFDENDPNPKIPVTSIVLSPEDFNKIN